MKKLIYICQTSWSLALLASTPLSAQMVTVNPAEASGPLVNPMMGFRSGSEYQTTVGHYIPWNLIENDASDSVQKIRDYCDAHWGNFAANNIKVVPRIILEEGYGPLWPADLVSGDYTNQAFKDRVTRLAGRLAEAWDNDPRVAWVQMGILGLWGEQESEWPTEEWQQRMGSAFASAFKNKKVLVRNMDGWPNYQFGVYWDSFGHPWQGNVSQAINTYNNQGRYLNQIIDGEVAYNWGEGGFDPLYGGEPELTLNSTQYTDNMIDAIRELHCSTLTWISYYALDGRHGTDPNTIRANAARMQKEFGYRFYITEFSASARTEPGANMSVSFKVKNKGSAPFYEKWPVAVVLIDQATRQIVKQLPLPNVDIRTWQPGHNYNKTSRVYSTPAQENQVTASVQVPADVAAGNYLVGLSIVDPTTQKPGVLFAVPNFFKESQSQPLCRVGIGSNASSSTLTGIAFDDLVNDDNRTYAVPPSPSGGVLSRTGWIPNASNSFAGWTGVTPSSAIDGNMGSGWMLGQPQSPGQWFQVDMRSPQTFNRLVMAYKGEGSRDNFNQYPRGYEVRVSNDGVNWSSPVATGTSNSNYGGMISVPFASQTAQFIRVIQTGSDSYWEGWAIDEFNVYAPAASTQDFNYGSATANFTLTAKDQARALGYNLGTFDNNTGGMSIYWRGAASDATYSHFDLAPLKGATINGAVNLNYTVDASYGGNITAGQVSTANAAWTFPGSTPGFTPVAGSALLNGNFANGSPATWTLNNASFQGFVNNPASFHGLVISGGSGSLAHYSGSPTLTGNATTNQIRVAGATNWSAAVYNAGSSTLSVSGANNVSGGNVTVHPERTLSVTNSATLGSGYFTGSILNNGKLAFGSSANQTLSGLISGSGTLTKSGTGTLTISGVNSVIGGATVNGGKLSLLSPSLADNSTVNIATTAILDLAHSTTDTVEALFIGGVQQNDGLYKSALSSGGGTVLVQLSGRGKLLVNSSPNGSLLSRAGWEPSASSSSSYAGATLSGAIDGDASSNWFSGTPQANGQWFQVDMLSPKSFNRIVINCEILTDFPRGYQINVSNDGVNWGSPIATGAGTSTSSNITIPFTTQSARYIRVTQTGSSPTNWWAINEFKVYGFPSPWQTADIGAVGVGGSASFSSITWTIQGSGVDIWDAADSFRYVSQSSSGDCSIVARVTSLANTDPWAKSGVMIRESFAPGAISAAVLVTPGNGVSFQWRGAASGSSSYTATPGQTAPKWLKVSRTGNSFAGFYSNDGTTWNQVGTAQTFSMATNATIGLALTSHNNGTLGTSTMDSVTAAP